jgi:hypothetical protein
MRTSEDTYEAVRTVDAVTVTIPYTYTNATGETVYINRCQEPDPPSLQKQQEGVWRTVYAPPRLLCLGPPVVIDAGGDHEGQLEVRAALDPNSQPQWEVERVPGTYRLVLDIFGNLEPGGNGTNPLDLEQRVSNTFEITERYERDADASGDASGLDEDADGPTGAGGG